MTKLPRNDNVSAAPKRPRGRPRDMGLRDRILDAAKSAFLEHGATVSLDKVAEAAGTTKMTLYSHFPSKEALFDAALTRPFARTYELDEANLDPAKPREALLHVGEAYLRLATSEDLLAQVVVLYQGAGKEPEVAKAVYESGPAAMIRALARYLGKVGSLRIAEPVVAAEQFLSLVRGLEQTRKLLSVPQARRGKQRSAYLESCVELFLKGYA